MIIIPIPAPEARPVATQTGAPISYNSTIRQENDPYRPRVPHVIQRNFHEPLDSVRLEIAALQERASGWDGYNAPAPNAPAINFALQWVQEMFAQASQTRAGWSEPRVSSDEGGNVTLQWRKGTRSLEIFVTPRTVEYLQVWGPRILSDMDDGDITHPGQLRVLWNWLHA